MSFFSFCMQKAGFLFSCIISLFLAGISHFQLLCSLFLPLVLFLMDYRDALPWKGFDRDAGTEARARTAYFAAEKAINANLPVLRDALRNSVDLRTRLQPGDVGGVTNLSKKSSDLINGMWRCPLSGTMCLHVNAQASHLIPCRGYADEISSLSDREKDAVHTAISADPEAMQFLCTRDDRFLHGMANLVMLGSECNALVNIGVGLEFNPTTNSWEFANHNPALICRPPRVPCSLVADAFYKSSAEVAQHLQRHNALMKILAPYALSLKAQAGAEDDFDEEYEEELLYICKHGLAEKTMSLEERVALLDAR